MKGKTGRYASRARGGDYLDSDEQSSEYAHLAISNNEGTKVTFECWDKTDEKPLIEEVSQNDWNLVTKKKGKVRALMVKTPKNGPCSPYRSTTVETRSMSKGPSEEACKIDRACGSRCTCGFVRAVP